MENLYCKQFKEFIQDLAAYKFILDDPKRYIATVCGSKPLNIQSFTEILSMLGCLLRIFGFCFGLFP